MTALAVPNLFERLVEQLVQEREFQGLTQRQLADRLQVTQPTVAKLESGGDVRVSTLLRWAAALGKVIDPLLVEAVSGLGDSTGAMVGTVYPDGTPLLLDLHLPPLGNRPPVLLLSGAPGSGKSRLLRLLVSQLKGAGIPGLVIGRSLDHSVASIVGEEPSRLEDLSAPLQKVVGLELFGRDLPLPDAPPSHWSRREAAAVLELEDAVPTALSLVPAGGFLFVEEVDLLSGGAERALEMLLRSARSSSVAVVLSAQDPASLKRWLPYASRVLAFTAGGPTAAAAALEVCGLTPTSERLREVSALGCSNEHYAIFRDVDGRTAPVAVGGSTLCT